MVDRAAEREELAELLYRFAMDEPGCITLPHWQTEVSGVKDHHRRKADAILAAGYAKPSLPPSGGETEPPCGYCGGTGRRWRRCAAKYESGQQCQGHAVGENTLCRLHQRGQG